MAFSETPNLRRNWRECPREGAGARWVTLYASMTPDGDIVLSSFTHRAMGEPDSYVLLYDPDQSVIGLRPARAVVEKNAYPVRNRGICGGKRIRGYTMCRQYNISVPKTVRFHQCHIDNSGVLILDLNQTRPVRHGRPRTRTRDKQGESPATV